MEYTPNQNGRKTAIIVGVVLAVLLVLLITSIFLFVNVSVLEPEDTETDYVPQTLDEEDMQTEEEAKDQQVSLTIDDFVDYVTAQGDWIYYSYTERGILAVTRISADGAEEQRTEVEWKGWWPMLTAFEVTDEGHFLFLLHEFGGEEEVYYYVKYNTNTGEVSYQNISDVFSFDVETTWVSRAIFDRAGNLFIMLFDEEVIYVFDQNRHFHGHVDLGEFWVMNASRARDGQVLLHGMDDNFEWVLKGIDLETNTLTEPISFLDTNRRIWNIYSAQSSAQFDLFLDLEADGVYHLYGFNMGTGALTFLLNWDEIGILPDFSDEVFFLENGRIAVLQRHFERDRFWSELTIFTP